MTITAEQRETRRQGIGSSDVPALFGVSPWKQPYDVWAEKVGKATEQDRDPVSLEAGDALEPVGLRWLGRRLGRQFPTPDTMRMGIFTIHPDGMDEGEPDLAEIKARSDHDNWGHEGTDEVPDDVNLQCQTQMLVASAVLDRPVRTTHVVRFGGRHGWTPQHFIVPAHGDLQRMIQDRCEDFWRRYVLTGTPPPILPAHATSESLLSRIERQAGHQVPVPLALVEEYDRAKLARAAAEDAEALARNRLLAALGDADGGLVEGWSVSYRQSTRSGIDAKALAAAHPEIAAKFATTGFYRTLRVTPKKEKKAT